MKTKFEPFQAKDVLHRFKKVDTFYQARYSLNPYRGCSVGCRYCFIQNKKFENSSGLEEERFQVVQIKLNAPHLLSRKLALKKLKPAMIVLGESCDPYADIEDEYFITRRLLEILCEYDFPIHIITRFNRVSRDIDLIRAINKKSFAAVTISIPMVSKELVSRFEGKSLSVKERLKTIKLIRKNNIVAGVAVSPVMPYISDGEEVKKVLKKAAAYGAVYVLYNPLCIKEYQREKFFLWLKEKYPRLIESYKRLYKNSECPTDEYIEKFLEHFKRESLKLNLKISLPVETEVE